MLLHHTMFSLLHMSGYKHKPSRNQKDLFMKLYSEKYLSIQEKQQHKCNEKWCLFAFSIQDKSRNGCGVKCRGYISSGKTSSYSRPGHCCHVGMTGISWSPGFPRFQQKGKYRFSCKFPNSWKQLIFIVNIIWTK